MEQLVKDYVLDIISRIFVGNKVDLVDVEQSKCKISGKEVECFVQKCGIFYIEISVYFGKNVERVFELIVKDIYDILDLFDIDIYIGSIDSIKFINDKFLWQKMGDCFWRWLFFWR